MCGIAGIIGSNPQLEDMDKMLKVMRHRGPEGTFFAKKNTNNKSAILGFLSLAFTDLAGGAQPMFNEDKTIMSVCNGEFYDFKQIRTDLQNKGHKFYTKSDSEIAIHLYEEYGLKMFEHLNGEFAFAIYDANKNILIMCRDRFGVKPLFYNIAENFTFASECKSILALMKNREMNPHYFNGPGFGSAENTVTPFKDIHSVKPGHYSIWDGKNLSHTCYWRPEFIENENLSYQDAQKKLKELTLKALERRIDTDIAISTSLSGGLDSTIITGLAKKYFNKNFKAVTLGFQDEQYSESPIAKMTADALGVDLIRVDLSSQDLLDNYLKASYHSESITKDFSSSARFLLNKAVKASGSKAVLSGEGADELMGGYAYFRLNTIRDEILKGGASEAHANIALSKFMSDEQKSEGLLWDKSPDWRNHVDRLGSPLQYSMLLGKADKIRPKILSKSVMNNISGLSLFESIDREFNVEYLKTLSTFNKSRLISKSYFSNFIAPSLGDRMEMAHCLEGRAPFLDRDVLNFCYTLKQEYCQRSDTFQGKKIMYDTFKDVIPAHFDKIGKQPFRSPTNQSILNSKNGNDLYETFLSRKAIKNFDLFNANTLGAIKLAWKFSSGSTFRKIDMNMGYFMSVQSLKHIFIDNFDSFADLSELKYPMIERVWDFS